MASDLDFRIRLGSYGTQVFWRSHWYPADPQVLWNAMERFYNSLPEGAG